MVNLRESEISVRELLDALPDATAVINKAGAIVAVNKMWNSFAFDNDGDVSQVGPGVNYLDVCARSANLGCIDAKMVAHEIQHVLEGKAVEREIEYSCASPQIGRWFLLRITPLGNPPIAAVLSHLNITARKVAQLDLERKASIDPLTGVNNRRSFSSKLWHALNPRREVGTKTRVGVVYLDLDDFKPVNDKFGHAMGDEILQIIALRLLSVVRKGAAVGRLGGDEFAVMVPKVSELEFSRIISRIENALSEPYRIDGQLVSVGVSAGGYLAEVGEDPDLCLRMADEAMYRAKRRNAI